MEARIEKSLGDRASCLTPKVQKRSNSFALDLSSFFKACMNRQRPTYAAVIAVITAMTNGSRALLWGKHELPGLWVPLRVTYTLRSLGMDATSLGAAQKQHDLGVCNSCADLLSPLQTLSLSLCLTSLPALQLLVCLLPVLLTACWCQKLQRNLLF